MTSTPFLVLHEEATGILEADLEVDKIIRAFGPFANKKKLSLALCQEKQQITSLDLEKAVNSAEWPYLWSVLHKFGLALNIKNGSDP